MGKLRSNFLGTKFTIFDSQPPANCPSIKAVGRTSSGRGSKQVSPKPPPGSFPVASISYELNVLGTRGPRRMQATLHSVPSSALEPGGFVPYPCKSGFLPFGLLVRSTRDSLFLCHCQVPCWSWEIPCRTPVRSLLPLTSHLFVVWLFWLQSTGLK
eukprot:TRINITY_DN13356_c0_g1_i3.p1 TRINITY_DN13356_c0_g1~~TRINITY_DN13356_c0_g1_i3.p1  ORF type:complete len:156 (+),score=5.44 TRINITY_DN13356_c0_g1_i3:694-1161(+)